MHESSGVCLLRSFKMDEKDSGVMRQKTTLMDSVPQWWWGGGRGYAYASLKNRASGWCGDWNVTAGSVWEGPSHCIDLWLAR